MLSLPCPLPLCRLPDGCLNSISAWTATTMMLCSANVSHHSCLSCRHNASSCSLIGEGLQLPQRAEGAELLCSGGEADTRCSGLLQHPFSGKQWGHNRTQCQLLASRLHALAPVLDASSRCQLLRHVQHNNLPPSTCANQALLLYPGGPRLATPGRCLCCTMVTHHPLQILLHARYNCNHQNSKLLWLEDGCLC